MGITNMDGSSSDNAQAAKDAFIRLQDEINRLPQDDRTSPDYRDRLIGLMSELAKRLNALHANLEL